ncbi:BHLH domain-containing protein, partial [Meloidogyne graminicola]
SNNNNKTSNLIIKNNNYQLINSNSKSTKLNKKGKFNIISKKQKINNNSNIGIKFGGKKPHQVARRNERERKRVQEVNNGYEKLANVLNNCLISICNDRKLTKAETLKTAILYIRHLEDLLKQKPKTIIELKNEIIINNNEEKEEEEEENNNFNQKNQKEEQQFLFNKNSPINLIYIHQQY